MIKVFTNDFRCDMMKKATGLQKGSRCLFFVIRKLCSILCKRCVFYAKGVFVRRKTHIYNKVKIGVRKWNFDHALTFITER